MKVAALAADALRFLLRGRALPLALAAGAGVGLFARAMRDLRAGERGATEAQASAFESLASGLFLAALVYGLVAGLALAAEDKRSGLLLQVALRPLPRLQYAGGRLLGTLGAAAAGFAVMLLAAAIASGIRASELPHPRERVLADAVAVDGAALANDFALKVAAPAVARFEFAAGVEPTLRLRLRVTQLLGVTFSGLIGVAATYVDLEDGSRAEWSSAAFRPMSELPLSFRGDGGRFAVELRPLGEGFALEMGRAALSAVGAEIHPAAELSRAALLVLLAQAAAASLAFVLGLGLGPGPAALAGAFLLLMGLGRETWLDVVAGLGADPHDRAGAGGGAGGAVIWFRQFLALLVRLVPDFAAFDPAAPFAAGAAIASVDVLGAATSAAAVVGAALLLAAAAAPLQDGGR